MQRKLPICVCVVRGESGELLPAPEWCAAKRQAKHLTREAGDRYASTSVPTLCGNFVILAVGVERRAPTCPDCRRVWDEQQQYPTKGD